MHCDCRKPQPGLLLQATPRGRSTSPPPTWLATGSPTCRQAGRQGSKTLFISSLKCYICAELDRQNVQPDYVVGSSLEAVEKISQEIV